MSVTELAIKRPILFIVFFILLLGGGVFSFTQLRYELLPTLDTPFVTVATVYPGAGPTEVETGITKKLEDGLGGLAGLKRLSAQSADNVSIITIEFLPGTNVQDATSDVQRAVSQVQPSFPAGAKAPSVDRYSLSDLPVLQLAATSTMPEAELGKLIKEQIKPRLGRIKGMGRITLLGLQEPEVQLEADPEKLEMLGISLANLVAALEGANQNVPAGNVITPSQDLGLRLDGKAKNYQALPAIPLVHNPDGSRVLLGDVATIAMGHTPREIASTLNQKAALGINVQKQTGANAVQLAAIVRAELAKIEAEYKAQDLRFSIAQDSSTFTLRAAQTVAKDLLIALGLVALVMLVFLHSARNAAIVMLAIPTSLATALIMMYALDYSLNLMTLLAMSLVIGILVDDSIVVLENIYRYLEMGKNPTQAALEGRNEIGFSALSITLVDVVVFLPMAFVPGLIGSIVKEFSLVVVASTLSSLVVSFTLTPMLASRFAQLTHLTRAKFWDRILLGIEGGIQALTHGYLMILKGALRRPVLVVVLSFGLLVSSFLLITEGFVGSEFVPSTDKGEIALKVSLAPGTPLSETETRIRELELRLKQVPELERIYTQIGYQNDSYGEQVAPNIAQLAVLAVPATERQKDIKELAFEVKKMALQVPGAQVRVGTVGILGAEAEPIQLVVSAPDRKDALAAAKAILAKVEKLPGIGSARLSAQQDKPELNLLPNPTELSKVGLTAEALGTTMRLAINGYTDAKLNTPTGEMPIRLRLDSAARNQPARLAHLRIPTPVGQSIELGQVAELVHGTGATLLDRRNKSASVMVLAQSAGRPVGELGLDIKAAIEALGLSSNVKVSYEGDLELQDDSFDKLGLALIASIVLVYLIMVSLYNHWGSPFVVLFSVPMALIGALLALALAHQTLNIFSLFGIIMLVGLVAKNAILLVDRANELRQSGRNIGYALLEAGQTRLRPILMTTLAMVIGMLPLALGTGAGSELNAPLAWVLIGGLSSSLLLTLVLVPAVYLLFFKSRSKNVVGRQPEGTGTNGLTVAAKVSVGLVLFMTPLLNDGQTLDLPEAIRLAQSRHGLAQTSRFAEERARLTLQDARAARLPSINLTGSYNRNIEPQKFFIPEFGIDANGNLAFSDKLLPVNAVEKNLITATLNASVPILDFGIDAQRQVARAQYQAATLQTQAQQQNIALMVKKTYLAALLAQTTYQTAEAALERAVDLHNRCRQMLAAGALRPLDTLATAAGKAIAQDGLWQAQVARAQTQTQLNALMAFSADTTYTLVGSLEAFSDMTSLSQQFNPMSRPDLKAMEADITATQYQKQVALSQGLPRLSAIAQYQRLAQDDNLDLNKYRFTGGYFVGLELSIPIFNGGQAIRNQKIAQTEQDQRRSQLAQAQTEAKNNLALAKKQYLIHMQRVRTTKTQVAITRAQYARKKDLFAQGALLATDLSEASLEIRKAEQMLALAWHDAAQAKADIEGVSGSL